MEECCICHEQKATSPDSFFCEECAKRYRAVLVATVILSKDNEEKDHEPSRASRLLDGSLFHRV
jgi:hypothetical protein